MADLCFIKASSGLVPGDAEAEEWLGKQKFGKVIFASVRAPRNGKFHRKFFAMLNVAYSNHDWPELQTQYGAAKTSFEMFRGYVTVKAGHYDVDVTPTGNLRLAPKSIAFVKMSEDEFSKLYSDVLDVILQEFLTNWTSGDMENAVNTMLGFCG